MLCHVLMSAPGLSLYAGAGDLIIKSCVFIVGTRFIYIMQHMYVEFFCADHCRRVGEPPRRTARPTELRDYRNGGEQLNWGLF